MFSDKTAKLAEILGVAPIVKKYLKERCSNAELAKEVFDCLN